MIRLWLAALTLLIAACNGCTSTGAPNPAVVPSVNLAVCIFDQYATNPACRSGGNVLACVSGIASACGSDVVSVENVLDAHRKAEVADGFVVPPSGDR